MMVQVQDNLEAHDFDVSRPITIILSNGKEYSLKEKYGELIINSDLANLVVKPEYSNQISITSN